MIVVSAARLYADILQCRNLNASDMFGIPCVGKNWIGKADSLHVAHHFFAQVMVDTVDIFRSKSGFQALIECFGIVQGLAERLFQNHLAALGMSDLEQAFGDGGKETRGNCKVEDTGLNPLLIQKGIQRRICGQIGKVHAVIMNGLCKGIKGFVSIRQTRKFSDPLSRTFPIFLIGISTASNDDDILAIRRRAGQGTIIQGRQ